MLRVQTLWILGTVRAFQGIRQVSNFDQECDLNDLAKCNFRRYQDTFASVPFNGTIFDFLSMHLCVVDLDLRAWRIIWLAYTFLDICAYVFYIKLCPYKRARVHVTAHVYASTLQGLVWHVKLVALLHMLPLMAQVKRNQKR